MFLGLWTHHSDLSLVSCGTLPVCLSLVPAHRDTHYFGLGPTLIQYDVICWFVYIETFFFFLLFRATPKKRMEVPRLGVKLELQLPAYITATAMWDPS